MNQPGIECREFWEYLIMFFFILAYSHNFAQQKKKERKSLEIVPIDIYDWFSHLEWVLEWEKKTAHQMFTNSSVQSEQKWRKIKTFHSL